MSATRRIVSKYPNSIKIRSRQTQVAQTISIKRRKERIFIFYVTRQTRRLTLCVCYFSFLSLTFTVVWKMKLWPNNILWHESVRINNIRLGRILTTDINLHQRSERDGKRMEIKFRKNRIRRENFFVIESSFVISNFLLYKK